MWGERVWRSPLISYKGELYLELKVERILETTYFSEGKRLTTEEVAPFLDKEKENLVKIRTYKL